MERRLAAILAADVVGYSRLMGADEAGTLEALRALRAELFDPRVDRHNGRTVKLMGDGTLIEFASVVDAVNCAVDVQAALAERNAALPEDRRLALRIGINLGDVIVDEDDLYGDGVNIAARLEGLAEPGGIVVSDKVTEEARGKLAVGFEDLGERALKNIDHPVRVWRVAPAGAPRPPPRRRGRGGARPLWLAFAAVLVAALAAGAWLWQPWRDRVEAAAIERMAHKLPDRPSIIVLPFRNNSDDEQLGYFASGLTGDLTNALSKAPGLFVIARNSAATYGKGETPIATVAEEMGVQYVLGGAVQKSGDKLRISVRLTDALSGLHVWSGRYDRFQGDVFALQDEITREVWGELRVELTEGSRARKQHKTESYEAWIKQIEGYGAFLKFDRESMARARELWQEAAALDPKYAIAVAGIGLTHWADARWGWSASREESLRLAKAFAERAIELDPAEPLGYQTLGTVLFQMNRPGEAIAARERALELAPNDFAVVAGFAIRLSEFGRETQAVELLERALRLSPKPPWWVPWGYARALHLVGRKREAVQWFQRAIDMTAGRADIRAQLAAVYVDLGEMELAREEAARVLETNPRFTVTAHQQVERFNDPARAAWMQDLLLRAGLPE